MISLNSVGHFFAKVFHGIAKGAAVVGKSEATVEAVTSFIDPSAVPLERAAYALLGEVSSAINTGDTAVAAKLSDAGIDISVIKQVEDILKQFPQIAAAAKTLQPPTAPPTA